MKIKMLILYLRGAKDSVKIQKLVSTITFILGKCSNVLLQRSL